MLPNAIGRVLVDLYRAFARLVDRARLLDEISEARGSPEVCIEELWAHRQGRIAAFDGVRPAPSVVYIVIVGGAFLDLKVKLGC